MSILNRPHKPHISLKEILLEYWWVVLFTVIVSMLYHQAAHSKITSFTKLQDDLAKLEFDHQIAKKQQEDLIFKIKSQEDPEWLEMVLKRKLGVVPDGQIKVHFSE